MGKFRTRGISAVLALIFLLGAAFCACAPASSGEEEATTLPVLPNATVPAAAKDTLTLPFAQRDVINPYAAATELNLELAPLLYEGLFLTDETHQAQPVLAKEIEQLSPTQWSITLAGGRVFHNGAAVTPADVLYSFEKARACGTYAARLENISAMKESEGKLELSLKKANVYIAANLDFPVVPDGSAEEAALKQAENGYYFTLKGTPPGSGRYQLKSADGGWQLSYDPRHPGDAPSLTKIALFGVNNSAALLYGLEMGNYHFAYDNLEDGEAERVSAATVRVPTTNLVYLGMHSSKGALADAPFRAALAACIDHAAVLTDAYHGYAQAVSTPFPPGWHGIHEEDFVKEYDPIAARQALEALGYSELKDGIRASKYRKLSFTLLVNKDSAPKLAAAKAIQKQLKDYFQIEVKLSSVPLEDYAAAIKTGNFDLYLGELRLTPDCGLSPLLISGGAATKGVQVWGKASSAYGQLLQGLILPGKFASIFREDMPFLPLGYRMGMAVSVRSLHTGTDLRRNDLFCAISSWTFQP